MSDFVQTTFVDGIFTIILNHPKANAISLEMVRLLREAFREAARLREARVVLLRSEGTDFSAGQDIFEMLKAEGVS
jgi:enoyl-CoA hydratase/carnithine racemase